MTVYQNARVYWEMYDGVEAEGNTQHVRDVDLDMDVGGWAADTHAYCEVAVYGRKTLDGANLDTLYHDYVTKGPGGAMWKPLKIRVSVYSLDAKEIRCIVVKLEITEADPQTPDDSGVTKNYQDQHPTADPPPWGIRIHESAIYASSLGRMSLRADKILRHILEGGGFSYSGPMASWEPDQLAFVDLPKDRWEALDEINGMLGWNYACWDGESVVFALPKSGTDWHIAADDPRTEWSVTESLDETYNAVRVCYTNAKGKPRELILHGDESAIGFTRADCIQAPESIISKKGAQRFGNRYLRAHEKKQVSGRLTIQGDDGVCDPLLIRPGDTITMTGPARTLTGEHEVTAVTLHPLDWSADVSFGLNSKRFDTWLARLAVGAKKIKRR